MEGMPPVVEHSDLACHNIEALLGTSTSIPVPPQLRASGNHLGNTVRSLADEPCRGVSYGRGIHRRGKSIAKEDPWAASEGTQDRVACKGDDVLGIREVNTVGVEALRVVVGKMEGIGVEWGEGRSMVTDIRDLPSLVGGYNGVEEGRLNHQGTNNDEEEAGRLNAEMDANMYGGRNSHGVVAGM
jgi:hypothetical protein